MAEVSTMIISLAIIFSAIFIAPLFSVKAKIPLVVTEIMIGIIIGKSFLNIIVLDPWLRFFSYFGLIYLLFLAGLEVEFEEIKRKFIPIIGVTLGSLLVPLFLGVTIGFHIGVFPLFLGVVLSTTSLGIILPLSKELRYKETFLNILLGATVLVDIVSMFLLAISIEFARGFVTTLFTYSIIFVVTLFMLPILFERLKFGQRIHLFSKDQPHFHFEVRFCFALIVGLALLTESIGFHAILGAFIAGLIVSEVTWRGSDLEQNLISFGYGFFIPFFFIMVGVNTDLPMLFSNVSNLLIFLIILTAGIAGKVLGAGGISKIFGLTYRESIALGFISAARLSLVLAGAEIGWTLGIIDNAFYSILVLFSIISVLIGPSIGKFFLRKGSA